MEREENLQRDLTKPISWAENWVIELNISECKKVLLG